MTVYWLYKYLKDEDLAQVDFKRSESILEANRPMLSFCVWNPIVESKLLRYNGSLKGQNYIEILEGEQSYNGIDNIDFDDVTINLNEYLLGDYIKFRNGTLVRGKYPNTLNELPLVTYAGVREKGNDLVKCFGLRSRFSSIDYVGFGFNSGMFSDGVRSNYRLSTYFHLPDKLFMAANFENWVGELQLNNEVLLLVF